LGGIAPSIIKQTEDVKESLDNELIGFRKEDKEISDNHSQNTLSEESVLVEIWQDGDESPRRDSGTQLPPADIIAQRAHADRLENEVAE